VLHAAESTADNSAQAGESLQEVVVTAQKRQEKLRDVPLSIAVASDEVLKAYNVASFSELQRIVPGFNLKGSTSTSNGAGFTIRGVGTNLFGGGIQGSVGAVIDGVVMGRQSSNLFNFNDVDHVEVLRGPQGTLFGMNASAGVLNIVTKDPTNDLSGNVSLTYGSYDERKIDGAVSGPLIQDKLLFRLSVFADKRDGFIRNVFDGRDMNDDDQKGFRGKLLFEPLDGTVFKLSADFAQRTRNNLGATPARSVTRLPVAGNPFAVGSTQPELFFLSPLASSSNNLVDTTGSAQSTDRIRGVSLQWDQNIGDYRLTSITAYRTWDQTSSSGIDGVPLNGVGTIPPMPPQYPLPIAVPPDFLIRSNAAFAQHQTTQELRLASPTGGILDYVLGAFLFDQRLKTNLDQGFLLSAALGGAVLYGSTVDTLNYAGFVDANIHPTDELTFFGGARWTHETIDMTLIGSPISPVPGVATIRLSVPQGTAGQPGCGALVASACGHNTQSLWSWRGGARFKVATDSMLYGTVARGFKGAGFNTNSGVLGNPGLLQPEISTNYEVGTKSQFLRNRIQTNLALFYETFDNFQTTSFVQTLGQPTGVGSFVPANAGKLHSKGVELQFDALLPKNITVNVAATYIDAVYAQFLTAPCYTGEFRSAAGPCFPAVPGGSPQHQDLSGFALANTPKWSVNSSVNYDFALPGLPLDGFVHADYSWRSRVQWDPNQDPRGIESSVGLLGASVGAQSKDRHYRLTVYGKNLTNAFHTDGIAPGATTTMFLAPDYQRIYGATFEVHY
jgi:iron complex outermembrane receptor protein